MKKVIIALVLVAVCANASNFEKSLQAFEKKVHTHKKVCVVNKRKTKALCVRFAPNLLASKYFRIMDGRNWHFSKVWRTTKGKKDIFSYDVGQKRLGSALKKELAWVKGVKND